MKYQVLKKLKTKNKLLKLCDTIEEAKEVLKQTGARFNGLSYIGNFPTFMDDKRTIYSIQGRVEGYGIVCSIPQKEVEQFTY